MSLFPEISFHISCPYTPEQNGIAERKHRHVVELGLACMYHSSIPLDHWDTIFESIVFVINRLPSQIHNMISPFEVLFHQAPDYQFLHTLGCECFPLLRPYSKNKLQPRSDSCVFMGYSALYKGYKCYHIPTKKMYINRHVTFKETVFPFAQNTPLSSESHNILPSTLHVLPAPMPIPPQVLPPTSGTIPPVPVTPAAAVPTANLPESALAPTLSTAHPGVPHTMTTRSKTNCLKPKQFPHHQLYTATKHPLPIPTDEFEPTCFSQAVKSNNWRQAMASELDALAKNNTWQLVDPPLNANVIGCKWLFKIKKKADGTIERYKARLVAKGFTQEEGLDYFETFSPVVKPTSIRVVLTIALSHGWPVHQLDVNNAFLHGDLEETIFMQQPPGFVDQLHSHKVCLLKKALYGLKQAPRAWFYKLKAFLLSQQFKCSQSDNSLFVFNKNQTMVYLLVYVDDIIITGNCANSITALIQTLGNQFSIKDLGMLNYFLGIEVLHDKTAMHLSQSRYLHTILQRTNMAGAKPCKSPIQAGLQLSKYSGTPLPDPTTYRMTVGALQYATITRPDITFAVNKVSQFMANPSDTHWQAVKRILRYLKGTIDHGIYLKQSTSLHITAFSNSDWAGCPDDRKSTTCYAVFLGSNIVSWSSKKQSTVSRSSTEAEYRSMAMATSEIIWLQSLLTELCHKSSSPPTLWCDNLGATFLAANPVFHARTKHIELDFHFVRDQVAAKKLNIQFVCSLDQIADVLTKGLSAARFQLLRDKLTVLQHPLRLRGPVETQNTTALDTSSLSENGDE